jgi:hypothetical protein
MLEVVRFQSPEQERTAAYLWCAGWLEVYGIRVSVKVDFLQNLQDTPSLPHYTLASLDITNLYPSIPISETKTILTNILKHNLIDPQTKTEILNYYEVITQQNYFSHNGKIIIHQDGLAMGAPSSGLIAEIFLQHLEHTHNPHLTQKHHIAKYCRYVDDIFIVFDSYNTSIQKILNDFNNLHPKLQFTAEFYIHTEARNNNHLNDDHNFFPNAIFEILLKSLP